MANVSTGVCRLVLIAVLLASGVQAGAARQTLDKPALDWMQAALDNWEAVSRRDLHIATDSLPWIIFYDESHAWHLEPERRLLPAHEISPRSLRFGGRTYPLIRVAHQGGTLWVPERAPIPVDPAKLKAVTMPYDGERKSFFIVPLPALFYRLAGPDQSRALSELAPGMTIPDQFRDLSELFLGLTAHELTHTRQFPYAMPQISRLRSRYELPESFDDNIIEQEFRANDEYKRLYEDEQKLLTAAVLAGDLDDCRRKVAPVLAVSRARKERFFVGDKAGYSDLEDVFLAMEGQAMWVQYRTARERAAAGEYWLKTLSVLSQRHDAWSQEEGLGLFLLIDRLVPGWQARFLAPDPPSPFAVLGEAIRGGR